MKHAKNQFLRAYDEYAQAIFRHCYFRVFNRERAKELMQETFLRTWKYIGKGQKIDNLKAFLYRTANNLIIDESRKKKESSLDKLEEEGFEPALEGSEPQDFLELKRVLKALDKVDPKYRDVVSLRYLDDLSVKEIAQLINETENNVSVRLHRALQKLKESLNN